MAADEILMAISLVGIAVCLIVLSLSISFAYRSVKRLNKEEKEKEV
jgi:hypothetical protein